MKTALSFDDVLLVPQHNEIVSRKDVDTSTKISKNLTLKIPIISSCMDTVTGPAMAIAMYNLGGLGILHRYNSIEQQLVMFREVIDSNPRDSDSTFKSLFDVNCAVAIGAVGDYIERSAALVDAGVNVLCVDVAHGDSVVVETAVNNLRKSYPEVTLIAGNVATGEGCARVLDAGADAVRAGIGGGSLCTTRIMTGHGVPTLQTIFDCHEFLQKRGYKDYCVLADGGIKNGGDLVKSIAAGASAVILGQLLAATDESPGELVEHGTLKKYRGMSSYGAQSEWRPENKEGIVPEGDETYLPYKGSVKKVLHELVGGLRSGMTYSNAKTLTDLQNNANFVRITSSGWAESKPHAKQ